MYTQCKCKNCFFFVCISNSTQYLEYQNMVQIKLVMGFDPHLPLRGEDTIEVCAAGVSWRVLFGKDISQNVKALATPSILTHQLSLKECCPASL